MFVFLLNFRISLLNKFEKEIVVLRKVVIDFLEK